MALAPNVDISIDTQDQDIQTSRTYRLDLNANRIIGIIDEVDALKQAIYKIMQSERFAYLIYSSSFGTEKQGLMSRNYTDEFIESEFKRLTQEALLQDERVLNVRDFKFEFSSDYVDVEFMTDTVFGEIKIQAGENIVRG